MHTSQVPVVDPQADLKVGAQVLDALQVGDGKGHHFAHHQIDHHTMGLEAVTTGSSVSWECQFIHHECLSIRLGHGGTSRFHGDQLGDPESDSMGTSLTVEHDVERGDPISDQLTGSSPGIISEEFNDVHGEGWLSVLICGRSGSCDTVVNGHLEH